MDTMSRGTPPSLNDAVAAVLRGEVKSQDITYGVVAEASGIPYVSLQRYLAGKRLIDVEKLDALASALGLTPEEVLSAARRRMERALAAAEAAASVTAPVVVDTTPVPTRPAHGRSQSRRGAARARGTTKRDT